MEAGSTRPRSKSGSSADSASANEESHLSKNSPQKQRNGTSAPTTTRPPSNGNSPARKQDSNYSTESRGRDTSSGLWDARRNDVSQCNHGRWLRGQRRRSRLPRNVLPARAGFL